MRPVQNGATQSQKLHPTRNKLLVAAEAASECESKRFSADQMDLNQKLEAQSATLRETKECLQQDQARYSEETDQLRSLVE